MSAIDDPWAGSAAPAPLAPPRPDIGVQAAPAARPPTFALGSYQRSETWKRIGAILGIVWAFFFLLTIPGWLALSRYKKWKRDEVDTPYGLIWWGYGFTALIVVAMLASAGGS